MREKKFHSIITLAHRSPHWKEFKLTCQFMQVAYTQALREAMFKWLEGKEVEIDRILNSNPNFREAAGKNMLMIFSAVIVSEDLNKTAVINSLMRNWLDKNRVPNEMRKE